MSLGTFLESLCLLRMSVVARLTASKPKMSTENAATDRKLFVWRFPLTFLREIWLLTYMGIRWNVARVSMRRWRDRCTCTWWRSWSRCASECGRWWRSGRGGGVWDCRKNSERPKQRFAAWKSFGRICHRFGRIWIGRVRASGTFEDNSIYFESAEESLQTRAVFSGKLKFLRLVPIQLGRGSRFIHQHSLLDPILSLNWLKTLENSEWMSKTIFLRLRDNFFLHGNRFKSWVILWIFQPRFTDDTQLVCVNCAEDTDSYRKNAKMTYYLFCPPFHSESKELTTEKEQLKRKPMSVIPSFGFCVKQKYLDTIYFKS